MKCADCRLWLIQRVTDYEDGSRIINFKSRDGFGLCERLGVETEPDFGCNKFEEGNGHIEVMGKKIGSPWQHSHWGPCPECNGTVDENEQWTSHPTNGGMCGRCAATGRVLYYDDGYIGEEKTRRHPNELKGETPLPPPACLNCQRDLDPKWMACPYCGTKTNKPDDPIRVTEIL